MTEEPTAPAEDKRATLGHPAQIWTPGLERRLDLVRKYVDLEGQRILELGCGVGAFVRRLREFSDDVYGFDVDEERVRKGAEEVPNLALAVGEHLPYADETFDVVMLHEVLEHVTDDVETLRETGRVLRKGGRAIVFTPNRAYPFETHGIYLGKRYIFGNIPFVNYLPDLIRDRLVPHARVYTTRKLRRAYRKARLKPLVHTYVFPGYDHIMARHKVVGRALRLLSYPFEHTPLRIFGLSHFVVLEKA
jgi:SAM-dependent methyltransferase